MRRNCSCVCWTLAKDTRIDRPFIRSENEFCFAVAFHVLHTGHAWQRYYVAWLHKRAKTKSCQRACSLCRNNNKKCWFHYQSANIVSLSCLIFSVGPFAGFRICIVNKQVVWFDLYRALTHRSLISAACVMYLLYANLLSSIFLEHLFSTSGPVKWLDYY